MTSRRTLRLATAAGEIEVIDEPVYAFGSADNLRTYPHTPPAHVGAGYRPNTTRGVLLDGEPLAAFADHRPSGINANSALYFGDRVHLAVGGQIVCSQPQPFEVLWQLEVDPAACFGIHDATAHSALISHGELSITRYSADGHVLWQTYGEDIFSEGFALRPDGIEAVDFNGRRYRFSYDTGEPLPDLPGGANRG